MRPGDLGADDNLGSRDLAAILVDGQPVCAPLLTRRRVPTSAMTSAQRPQRESSDLAVAAP